MAENSKTKITSQNITREYKATSQLEAEAASLNWVAALVTAVVVLAGACLNRLMEGTWQQWNIYIIIVTALAANICFFGIKIANQWERAVVLRLGRFRALKGPGPFFIIPIIETVVRSVDMQNARPTSAPNPLLRRTRFPSTSMQSVSGWSGTPRKPSSKSRISTWPSYFRPRPPCVTSSGPTSFLNC